VVHNAKEAEVLTLRDFEKILDERVEIEVLTRRLQKTYDARNQYTSDYAKDYRTGEARPITIVGYTVLDFEKADAISEKIKEHCKRLEEKIIKAEEFILQIQESRVRTLLTLHYLEGKSWKDAAKAFYVKMSDDTARLTVQRYFESIA
jgi:hypothetical protein